jgi:uncharacterized protein YybS (DUF2232 family)
MECPVVVKKILEVGEQRSIVKTFFVMEGVQKTSIVIVILALFLLSSNFHKMNIPTASTKIST